MGMEFWQAIVSALFGALISGATTIINNRQQARRAADEREDAKLQRAEDREHEIRILEANHARARDDAERKQLIAALQKLITVCNGLGVGIAHYQAGDPRTLEQLRISVTEPLATAMLLGREGEGDVGEWLVSDMDELLSLRRDDPQVELLIARIKTHTSAIVGFSRQGLGL